jgi:hypothetical protein
VSKDLKRPSFSELERVAQSRPLPFANPQNTTHYSVVDAEGNAVAVTTTLNDTFGSRVTAEGLGFLLNDEMDDFAAKQGVPNAYGLIQGPANAIGPGKRPLSAMTPTIVLKDGKLFPGSRLARRPHHHHVRRQRAARCGRFLARHSGSRQCAPVSSSVAPRSDSRRRPPLSRYNECSAFQGA